MRHRLETFGGIVSSDDPPFLAFVDRQYLREQGVAESPLWQGPEEIRALSAPVEVHFACTNRCSLGCAHCYMASGAEDRGALDTAEFKQALDTLARLGVFHVALGGGEALERDDLFDLAAHARQIGLVPNLTTNGHWVDDRMAERLLVFGQVNLSLDGVGAAARTFRDGADFAVVDRAFGCLQRAGVAAGINCVVGRRNVDGLRDLFRYAAEKEIAEIELLRFKPSGRGLALYERHRATPEQNRAMYPLFRELSETTGVRTKIDCSFVPMLCWHRPPVEWLEAYCVCGCEAGNFLIGVRSNGRVCGCSFLPATELRIADLPQRWMDAPEFARYRRWPETAPEPCASCAYLRHCKGGCHAVALAVHGDAGLPDPDCPRVEDYRAGCAKHESHANQR